MKQISFIFCFLPLVAFGQLKESWVTKPKELWPQIALVNDVTYKNGNKYEDPTISYAASGFLLDTGKDTLAITAKHIIWVARNKASDKVYINDHLKTWKMYPKHNLKDSVIIDRLINEDLNEKLFNGPENGVLQRDWLVFTTKYVSPNIKPVKLREKPVKVGDKVYLIGNPYRFDKTLTAEGYISKKAGNTLFVRFNDPAIRTAFLGGASGSPILDENGQLAGIFSNGQLDPKTGERITYVNSTAYLKKVLARVKPLNVDKEQISTYVDSLIEAVGTKKAMSQFEKYVKTEKAQDIYELTYINYNKLITIGEKLSSEGNTKDAVLYFETLLRTYPENHLMIIALSKAYNANQQKQKAIDLLELNKDKVDPDVKGEIEKNLNEIKAKK
ncbi:trypsin-like peptidase domain-containing protein [Emticicia sp. C21]|uniref:trypsin-like peptidase domain-containing protein n=1 Tax=Emticicia sp. C21 TaxID=2302915 RepID=UPI000E34E2FD|nr:trypsin-like peptidase domain-containing protein [Emticicia sp. C21]RFS16439.1 hypothetical protein D0T08_12195 [Emticicia sp. C21]